MDEAPLQAADGGTGREREQQAVSRALEALRRKHGGTHWFGRDGQGYWAARPDVIGSLVRAADPDELGKLVAVLMPERPVSGTFPRVIWSSVTLVVMVGYLSGR